MQQNPRAPESESRGTDSSPAPRARGRSFCFLEHDGDQWTVFLVTYPSEGRWRGYFSFRPASASLEEEVRTADLWIEPTEPEVDARARGLGRPLILSLLKSALDAHERRKGFSSDMRTWFRELLARHSATLVPDIGEPEQLDLLHLRSLYESYRIDQVAHLISLMPEDTVREVVDGVLEGRQVDFNARDRLQLAMLVVQELERFLPLPPFEAWSEDYLVNRDEYHRYSHALHREGRLT